MKKTIFFLLCCATCATTIAQQADEWVGTWAAAAEYTGQNDMPRTTNLQHCTLRQVVKVSLGGDRLRLQLSNAFSKEPVEIKSVYIADALDSCDINASTARYLLFDGKKQVTIAAGQSIMSDAARYNLKPLQRLSITIEYGNVPQNATSHRGSRTTSYITTSSVKPKQRFQTTEKLAHWYNIAAIDVPAEGRTAIAALGNSITDGRGSTTDLQNRWPDMMSAALQGNIGVLNLGIGGNCVVKGGLSEPALKRFDRDILQQRGVTHLILFEGVNDIGGNKHAEQTASNLISAYKELIGKAHAKGIKVYGGTILPFGRSGYWSYFNEAVRQTVNEWIRTSGAYDGVIDFDQLMRDPEEPTRLRAEWQDDWLHPNAKGYKAMGEFAATFIQQQLGTVQQ